MGARKRTANLFFNRIGDDTMNAVDITYFSDVLCIWAYAAQARIDTVKKKFGDTVRIEHRFCSVFGNTVQKIPAAWKDKGGYEGFNSHLQQTAAKFPHIELDPEVWLKTRPATSMSPHLFMKALQQWIHEAGALEAQSESGIFDRVMWGFRCAFFRDGRDISLWGVQREIAQSLGVDIAAIEKHIHSGAAFAQLASDYQDADKMRIEGSPSFVLNEGRQKLYGNVGFRIIEANIQELLRAPRGDQASWC